MTAVIIKDRQPLINPSCAADEIITEIITEIIWCPERKQNILAQMSLDQKKKEQLENKINYCVNSNYKDIY